MTRKCKVCGRKLGAMDTGWCNECDVDFERVSKHGLTDTYVAAEWGAKRRAAAKAGGK